MPLPCLSSDYPPPSEDRQGFSPSLYPLTIPLSFKGKDWDFTRSLSIRYLPPSEDRDFAPSLPVYLTVPSLLEDRQGYDPTSPCLLPSLKLSSCPSGPHLTTTLTVP